MQMPHWFALPEQNVNHLFSRHPFDSPIKSGLLLLGESKLMCRCLTSYMAIVGPLEWTNRGNEKVRSGRFAVVATEFLQRPLEAASDQLLSQLSRHTPNRRASASRRPETRRWPPPAARRPRRPSTAATRSARSPRHHGASTRPTSRRVTRGWLSRASQDS